MNDEASIPGIDVPAVTAWFTEHTDAAPPLSFELIAGGRSNLTFRVTDTADGAWVLRRPPTRPRAGHRPRHGPRAPHHLRPRPHRRARRPGRRPLHRRVGQRRARSTSWTSSTAWCIRDQVVAEEVPAEVRRAARPVAGRHPGQDPRRRPRRGRPRRARPQGGLHRPPAQAVERPVRPGPRPRGPRGHRGLRAPARAHPRAGPGRHRPRRLPARQLHGRRRRQRSSPSSTGRSARSATPSPTSAC